MRKLDGRLEDDEATIDRLSTVKNQIKKKREKKRTKIEERIEIVEGGGQDRTGQNGYHSASLQKEN